MAFKEYFKTVDSFVGGINLVFEFKKSIQGINYYLNEQGNLNKYLESPHIVRDREKLKDSKEWLLFKNDFNKKIIVGYQDLWFYCHETVWSPSIDAIFLIDTLINKEHLEKTNLCSVLDFGCGTGVVGITIANINKKIKNLYFLDSNAAALHSTLINIIGNGIKCNYNLINSLDDSKNFTLGLVTPYYFPIDKESSINNKEKIIKAGIDSAVLTNLVANKAKTTYFIYSSTTEKYFLENLKYDFEIIDELLVPFTLGDNVSSQEFFEIAMLNNLLIYRDIPQFKYWHKIIIGKIQNQNIC